jgi:predicted ribosome quality control (RQC) complex YloA/Tae2 family protein
MKEFEYDGHRILLGKDRSDNVQLLKNFGHTDYTFMHLKSYPSSHVIIMTNTPSDETLEFAAQACKQQSKYKNLRGVKAIYTAYSNVRKTDVPGAVVFKSNRKVKNITIPKLPTVP